MNEQTNVEFNHGISYYEPRIKFYLGSQENIIPIPEVSTAAWLDERLEFDETLDRLFNWDFFDEFFGEKKLNSDTTVEMVQNTTPGSSFWCNLMEEFPNWLYKRHPELAPEFHNNQDAVDTNNEQFCMLGNPLVYSVFWLKTGENGLFGPDEQPYVVVHVYTRNDVEKRDPLYRHPRVYKIRNGDPTVMNRHYEFIIEAEDGSMSRTVDYHHEVDPVELKPVVTSDDVPESFITRIDAGETFDREMIREVLTEVLGHTDAYFLMDDDTVFCPPTHSRLVLRIPPLLTE